MRLHLLARTAVGFGFAQATGNHSHGAAPPFAQLGDPREPRYWARRSSRTGPVDAVGVPTGNAIESAGCDRL